MNHFYVYQCWVSAVLRAALGPVYRWVLLLLGITLFSLSAKAQTAPASLTVGSACLDNVFSLTKVTDDYNSTGRPAYEGLANVTLNETTYVGVTVTLYYEPTGPAWVLSFDGQPYLSNPSTSTNPPTSGWAFEPDPGGLGSCTGVAPLSLTLAPVPSVTVTPALAGTVCPGAMVSFTATPTNLTAPVTYTWNSTPAGFSGSGAILTQAAPSPVSATTYVVSVTASSGAESVTASAEITVRARPTVSITPSATVLCAGQSVILTATAGLTYVWSNSQTSQAISATAVGPYSVTASDAFGCSNTATATVTANTPVSLLAGGSISCTATTVTLTATAGFSSYTFSAGATQQGGASGNTATVSTTGVYSVTALDANSCRSATSVTVNGSTTPTPVNLVASGVISCTSTTITLTATAGFSSYTFSAGATQQGGASGNTATVSASAVYSVTALDANGCRSSTSVTVNGSTTPTPVTLSASGPISCTNGSVTITATPGFVRYVFSAGATQQGGASGNTATVSTTGVYSVTATNANACTSVTSVTVSGGGAPTPVSLSATGIISCTSPPTVLTATLGFVSYVFSSGASQVGGPGSNSATVIDPGLYSVVATNASGCTSTASATVSGNRILPTVTMVFNNQSTVVAGAGTATITVPATPGQQFQVFGGSSFEYGSTLDRINGYEIRQVDSNGTGIFTIKRGGSFTIIVRDGTGCSRTVQGEIVVR